MTKWDLSQICNVGSTFKSQLGGMVKIVTYKEPEITSSQWHTKISTICRKTTNEKDWYLPGKIFHKRSNKNKKGTTVRPGGGVDSWYNQSYMPQVTHKWENNYIVELHPQEWEFWVPHQACQPRHPAPGRWVPKAFNFEGQWSLIAGAL